MARQVLENGVILPAEYSDDWYDDMTSNLTKLDDVIGSDSEKLSSSDVGAAALSNNYNDLDNLPTIPTVNDATLTIQKNGVDVKTFTANASSNVTANITVPTKTSDLTNDSNFVDTSNSAVSSGITSSKVSDYDTHIADTDIHVTTADKNKWNAVTSKANDSDVVHNSGNETIAGVKSFSDDTYIKSLNNTGEVTSPSASSTVLLPIVATVTYIDQSPSQSATVNLRISADGSKSFYPNENGLYSLGLVSRNWDNVFSYMFESFGKNLGNEFSNNARTNLYLKANRDTSGQSGVYVSKFRQNRAQGEMSGSDVVQVTFDVLENSVRTNRLWYLNWVNWENDVPKTVEVRSFCEKVDYKLTHINGLEPSALGMPDLSNGIDISSYLSVGASTNDSYTAPANGYIGVIFASSSACGCYVYNYTDGVFMRSNSITDSTYTNVCGCFIPILKNQTLNISTRATESIVSAKFFPCLGNV